MNQGIVIKSKSEVDRMRAAGKLNALALSTVRKLIQPGITTAELDAYLNSHPEITYREEQDGTCSFRASSIQWYAEDSRRITNMPKEFVLQAGKDQLHQAITCVQLSQPRKVTDNYIPLSGRPYSCAPGSS